MKIKDCLIAFILFISMSITLIIGDKDVYAQDQKVNSDL